ncbi:pyridoxal-phosphate-dependent aminotransferase family protein [Sporosalibacterium faouarense]|uniref:pyridoxal-phosphate-dependent aminotransferase family protein n=1 Tax=Sporosalibacterium faouarense TaxID=516123 RepID=UPI00192C57A1|nr:alanine--glyoxylate aminotransferase family protein [Sporosalibacterium faouarense]
MNKKMIMTPGPTSIHEDVRLAMAKPITNPDLDPEFYEFYKNTAEKIGKLMNTDNEVLILSGEGILGLEAACASLIEPGDKVLCIENGIFGRGFGDFIKMYGGECTFFSGDPRRSIDIHKLEDFLSENNDFKLATMVHCETPSGMLNSIKEISLLLKKYNILTVVDAVSSIGGEDVKVDDWKIDIVLGGSQKCLSASPGLTFLSVSEDAWYSIRNRKQPIIGYYCNLNIWQDWYKKKWFPYTQPISDIYGLEVAVDRLLKDDKKFKRHERIANAVRYALTESGIELYPKDGWSNTVTSFKTPGGIKEEEVRNYLVNNYGIMIAGAFSDLAGKVMRIGHMGENCREEKVFMTLKCLDKALRSFGIKLKKEIHKEFINCLD